MRIGQLPSVASDQLSDYAAVEQSGATLKTTLQNILNLFKANTTPADIGAVAAGGTSGTLAKVSGNYFTLGQGLWFQAGNVVVLSLNYNVTQAIANGTTIAVLSGAPEMLATSSVYLLARSAGTPSAFSELTISSNGDGNIKLVAGGPTSAASYYIGSTTYISA